ncbi:MAG TPA: AAA family ATPase [Clostridium sp.]|nr:AAA family ATPase [Clostridium sp.]
MSYLKRITFNWNKVKNKNIYPFNIKSLMNTDFIDTEHNVVFLVGENGSGKSTLLEALAHKIGFSTKSGRQNSILNSTLDDLSLSSIMTLSWLPKINNGFFLRAETLFNYAEYLEDLANDIYVDRNEVYAAYGNKELYAQSHGESFLSVITNRFSRKGIYLLDEPEAALSPEKQIAFLKILHDTVDETKSQFVIATHSPIIMSYPKAVIYDFNGDSIKKIDYEDTEHFKLTKDFLDNRERYFKYLF